MNIRLLRKIQARILAEPKRFDMDSWIVPKDEQTRPSCGTACCIGGWAAVENGWKSKQYKDEDGDWANLFISPNGTTSRYDSVIASAAQKLLDITDEQASRLFYTCSWPEPYKSGADNGTPEYRAANGVARIKHFIETGE